MAKRKITSTTLPVSSLNEKDTEEMFALFEQYYTDISYSMFRSDLAEKNHVFLIHDRKRLIGFSTVFSRSLPNVPNSTFIFSGDTVMDRDYWGTRHLQMAFFKYIVSAKLSSPLRPVYWMLMSKGYKTYLMMATNFRRAYPRFNEKTPPRMQRALDAFYDFKFGKNYRQSEGLIRFDESHGAVKDKIAAPDLKMTKNPHVKFFLNRNPKYAHGIELACIAEVTFTSFIGHLYKFAMGFLGLRRHRKTQTAEKFA